MGLGGVSPIVKRPLSSHFGSRGDLVKEKMFKVGVT